MQQVSAQERQIAELSSSLSDRNQQLEKFQTEKKTEMEALMAGMKQWIGNLDMKNVGHKEEFQNGLQRLVDRSSFDNNVWSVMASASASANKMEESYQALKSQYDDLQQRSNGGVFGNAEHRVGDKRPADDHPSMDAAAVPDIWGSFIAEVSRSGYQVM